MPGQFSAPALPISIHTAPFRLFAIRVLPFHFVLTIFDGLRCSTIDNSTEDAIRTRSTFLVVRVFVCSANMHLLWHVSQPSGTPLESVTGMEFSRTHFNYSNTPGGTSMKIFASVMIGLAVMLLAGCSDNAGMTDPSGSISGTHTQLDKPKSEFPIDLKLIGPGGVKYEVTGVIKYTYLCDKEAAVFTTDAYLDVVAAGTDEFAKARGGQRFEFARNPLGVDLVTDAYTVKLSTAGEMQIVVQFRTDNLGVRLIDLTLTNGSLPRVGVAAAH
jgi:hypothetical protein